MIFVKMALLDVSIKLAADHVQYSTYQLILDKGQIRPWDIIYNFHQGNMYYQMPIFWHPFFRKQCFSLKYVLVDPLKIFEDMSKFEIYVIIKSSLQF